jgi:NADP-dependent 3-hydroxy acid dehydrogenase YdfG
MGVHMPVSLQDQTALVVGASSGIGRATAVLLAREGVRVMAAGRREVRLRALQAELEQEGHTAAYCTMDAARPEDAARLAEQTRERFGAIDIMVYATGTNTPDRSLRRLTIDLWDRLVSVNLSGAYYVTQAVLPAMRAAGSGHLIFVSSISAMVPDVSGAAYQAAKRGMLGLAHAIRMEEKENGIRTCVICPGLVESEMLNLRPVKTPPEIVAKAMQPEDVAEAIVSIARLPKRASVPELQVLPTYL